MAHPWNGKDFRMALTKVVAPSGLAVTLADAKAHCRVDGSDEDALITSLIIAATDYVEMHCRLSILKTRWSMKMETIPQKHIELPIKPLLGFLGDGDDAPTITYRAVSGTLVPWTGMWRPIQGNPPRLLLNQWAFWPTTPLQWWSGGDFALEVQWTAGYGTDSTATPPGLKAAILLLVANWYLNREAVGGVGPLPYGVDMLLRQFETGEYR